jgi:hypothetical protein
MMLKWAQMYLNHIIKATENCIFRAAIKKDHASTHHERKREQYLTNGQSNGRFNEPDAPPDRAAAMSNSSKPQVTSESDANGSVPGCDVKVSTCSLGECRSCEIMMRKSHWSR